MSTRIDLDFRPKSYFTGRKVEKVEIARITVNSVCLDSATLRAWPRQRGIQYQVSDGYDGQLLDGEDHTETDRPMSLGELADFLLSTWPLMKFLEMNYKDDLERALKFFWAESAFYPDLDRLCRKRVRAYFDPSDFGDECPFCDRRNFPSPSDGCEHLVAWVQNHEEHVHDRGQAFATAIGALREVVVAAQDAPAIRLILGTLGEGHETRARLIDAASKNLQGALGVAAGAATGSGWVDGMRGGHGCGSGYTICVAEVAALDALADECRAIVRACAMTIQAKDSRELALESLRPAQRPDWQLVISGDWSEDRHHSGFIAYYLANTAPGQWLLDGVERYAFLDNVTQEDIDEGRLNDDQLQALWGISLKEAQSADYRQIRALCSGASEDLTAREIAKILYAAVCEAGGFEVTEPDNAEGLIEPW